MSHTRRARRRTSTLTDRELVECTLADGCTNCQAELFVRYQHRMAGAAFGAGVHRELIDDCVQAAWIKAMNRLQTLRNLDAFGPWLLRISKNEAVNTIRQRGRELPTSPHGFEPPPGEAVDPADKLIRDQNHDALYWAMEQLKPADAALLTLLFVDGESYRRTAEELGCEIGSVGPRRGRSLSRLRKAYANAP